MKNKPTRKELSVFLKKIHRLKILIIGDLMLDSYEYGVVKRNSPEAPVPLINIEKMVEMPGGAGNVAVNISSIGVKPILISTIKDDYAGKKILELLKELKIPSQDIVETKKITSHKKRIVVNGKHFTRIDHESLSPITKNEEKLLLKKIGIHARNANCIIISDYAKGLITKGMISGLVSILNKRSIPVILDTKPNNIDMYKRLNLSMITPNEKEALEMSKEKNYLKAGLHLRNKNIKNVLVTRGSNGMALFEDNKITHLKSLSKNVVDVSGCGDTVVSFLAMAIGSGYSNEEAINFANYAASIVVSKKGTASLTKNEFLKNAKTN